MTRLTTNVRRGGVQTDGPGPEEHPMPHTTTPKPATRPPSRTRHQDDGGGIGGTGTASDPYFGTCSAAGWTTVSPNPPTDLYETALGRTGADAVSADLRRALRGGVRRVAPCNRASAVRYVGSAVDGSRVLLTTDRQLVNADADTDTTGDLYACDIPDGAPAPIGDANRCSTLREISGARDAGVTSSARVQNVPAVSRDGSRVCFVAQGVLADNLDTSNALAIDSAPDCQDIDIQQCHNDLYLWSVDEAHPDGRITFVTDLGGADAGNARMTPDGRYLVFGTAAPLIKDGPGADTDNAADLYRYDAQTGALARVSGSGGNTPGMDAANGEKHGTMTDDGSTIVFLTDDANEDIYDARIGGGFDLTRPAPCLGESCRAVPSSTPSLPGPSGNGSGDHGSTTVVSTLSLGKVSATQRRRLAQTGKLTRAVTTNTPGVVTLSGGVAGVAGAVATVRKTVAAASTVRVTAALSKKARARLAARGRLSVRLMTVGHSKVALSRSITLKLTHIKTKKSKAKAEWGSVTGSSTNRRAGAVAVGVGS